MTDEANVVREDYSEDGDAWSRKLVMAMSTTGIDKLTEATRLHPRPRTLARIQMG